jgi:alkylation response protein AidB-like acyl-CoA dehydrogenase
MDFFITQAQTDLQEATRDVLASCCDGETLRAPTTGGGRRRWSAVTDLGVPSAMLAESDGGLGLDLVDMVGVAIEVGRAALPEPLLETAVLAVPALQTLAPGNHGARVRAGLELAAGGVLTVGGVAVDRHGVVTTTTTYADAAVTDLVPGVSLADALLLACRSDGGLELHLVDRDQVEVRRRESVDRSRDLGSVTWRPRPETLIGSGTPAETALAALAARGMLMAAAQLIGVSEALVVRTVDYAKVREQFGRPIGSFQAVQHHLADAQIGIEFALPLTYRGACAIAGETDDPLQWGAIVKSFNSDAATTAARAALQIHGAIGYTQESDLHHWLRRAWSLTRAWGGARELRALALDRELNSQGAPLPW